jgi:hypothetical protein
MVGVTDQAVSLWERTGKVPMGNDRLIRLLILGKLDGEQSLSSALERVATLDRLVNQRIVVKETAGKRWRATIEDKAAHF